jgi:phosphatidylglycerol---prolipoprotein diacylglyceryl transferase
MHPILFHIGRFPIRSYGTMILAGFLLGVWYGIREIRRMRARSAKPDAGIATPEQVFDYAVAALLVSIVGARALYVMLNYSQFRAQPVTMVQLWQGGLSIHGAIVCGLLYTWWFCRRKKLRFLAFGDLLARGFALGYAVGRIGCFLNGCCYGHACTLPWAVSFHPDGAEYALTVPSHPTQLYATAFNLTWFAFLHWRSRKPHREGGIFLLYLVLYSIYRFIDEQFRRGATAEVMVWGLTQAQVASLVTLPVFLTLLLRNRATRSAVAEENVA